MIDDAGTGSRGWGWGNEGTLVAALDEPADLCPPLGPKVAFIAAYARMAELARHLPSRGFVAIAVDSIGRVTGSAVVGDRERLIVGRHTECDLRLDHASISLRQLAVFLRYGAEGTVLHVWDLATGTPFRTEEGTPEHALVSTGPLYVAIGRYAIWFVPLGGPWAWPPSAEAAFEALPGRTFVRSAGAPSPRHGERAAAPAGYRAPARPEDHRGLRTLVSGVEPPVALEEDEPKIPFAVLALETASARRKYTVCFERLARGILLGRYGRCDLLLESPEHRISRVHALLVRLGDETWILDTASTNGIRRGQEMITARALDDRDQLELSDELRVEWRRLSHALV